MDHYDPSEHKPLEVYAGPTVDYPANIRKQREREAEQLRHDRLHSKHVWFNEWQDKVLSIGRPV